MAALASQQLPSLMAASFLVLLLLLLNPLHTLAQTRAECLAQLGLANHACRILSHSHHRHQGHGSRHHHHHRHHHSGDGHSHHPGHQHHHHHHHGHHHRHEMECCRRLGGLDKACVCRSLLLHLPISLLRPTHNYTVRVGGTCSFTYQCGGV